jgi:hypothetical protein
MVIRAVWLAISLAGAVLAQEPTRAEEMAQQRDRDGGKYGDDELNAVERAAIWAEDHHVLDRLTRGFGGVRAVFGNLVPSAGAALGPEYFRDDLRDGAVQIRTSLRASTRKYLFADAELILPRLLHRRAYADVYTRWRNLSGVPYYGPGNRSDKNSRTAFRLEDVLYEAGAGVRPVRRARLGVIGGFTEINVGPGDDDRYPSTETVFGSEQVPGITHQTDFLHGGALASYDWRDNPGGGKYGGYYEARFDYFADRDLEAHTFRRLTLEAQQYIPFFNRRRVIALRAKTLLTYENAGQTLPFYMQTFVGGPNDLRGFQFGRFWDNNALVLNGEYRWEIFTGLDGALFFDAGKVFPRPGQLNFRDLKGSGGFGFRANVRNATFLRMDVGFSREGFQIWFSFNDVFGTSGGVAQSLYASRIGLR